MKQFEYMEVCPVGYNESEDLNKLGRDGWELIYRIPGSPYMFKREITPEPQQQQTKPASPSPNHHNGYEGR